MEWIKVAIVLYFYPTEKCETLSLLLIVSFAISEWTFLRTIYDASLCLKDDMLTHCFLTETTWPRSSSLSRMCSPHARFPSSLQSLVESHLRLQKSELSLPRLTCGIEGKSNDWYPVPGLKLGWACLHAFCKSCPSSSYDLEKNC